MSEDQVTLDAYSSVNEEGVPHLSNCTLIVGDGTMKVDFQNGRAKVPKSFAHLVAAHPQIEIPALAHQSVEAADVEKEGVEAPADGVEAEHKLDGPELTEEERAAALEAAREHLAEEGEAIPDVEAADAEQKPGFEATTADGAPRCQATKADGGQCANPAVDGSQACRLPKHQEQVA